MRPAWLKRCDLHPYYDDKSPRRLAGVEPIPTERPKLTPEDRLAAAQQQAEEIWRRVTQRRLEKFHRTPTNQENPDGQDRD